MINLPPECSEAPRTPMPTTPRRQAEMCAITRQREYPVLPREWMKRSRVLLDLAGDEHEAQKATTASLPKNKHIFGTSVVFGRTMANCTNNISLVSFDSLPSTMLIIIRRPLVNRVTNNAEVNNS